MAYDLLSKLRTEAQPPSSHGDRQPGRWTSAAPTRSHLYYLKEVHQDRLRNSSHAARADSHRIDRHETGIPHKSI